MILLKCHIPKKYKKKAIHHESNKVVQHEGFDMQQAYRHQQHVLDKHDCDTMQQFVEENILVPSSVCSACYATASD